MISKINWQHIKSMPAWKEWFQHYFGGLYHRVDQHHIFLMAGGLAFTLFVCVVPMVLILFSVLGVILQHGDIQAEINIFIERIIPYEAYASSVKLFIYERIEEFRTYRNIAGYIGGIGLLFAATSLFSSMRTVLNRVFHTGIDKHLLIGKLRDLGMVLLVLIYFLAATLVLPLLEVVKDSASHVVWLNRFELTAFGRFSFWALSFGIIFSVFCILYYLIPYEKLNKRVVLYSGLWATILWEIARQAFGYYITHVASLKAIYGTYVFLVVVAFWIYYSAVAFILGAEIGQLCKELMHKIDNVNI